MIRGVLLAAIFCFLFSCNDSPVPKGIIDPKEMKLILWDVIRVDILAEEIAKKDSLTNKEKESARLSKTVFNLHHTTQIQFENSLDYYSKHPAMMKVILDSLNSLQVRKIPITVAPPKKAQ